MSDQAKVFRGDSAPEAAQVAPSSQTAPRAPVPSFAPTVAEAPAESVLPAPQPPAQAAPTAPPPPLDFQVEQIERWHAPDAVTRRLAQLAAVAHDTAHQLDEQAQQAELIAKRMKSL